jgi:uncharacterized protein involved in exopolysaccharide biosynthesis
MSDSPDARRAAADAEARPPAAASPTSGRDDEVDEVSLLELVNVLLKRWKLVVGLPLAAAFVAGVISLIVPPKYTATATFVPEEGQSGMSLPGGLAGLAAQFGVAVPSSGATGPAFYADVLQSRTLLDAVLLTRFPDPRSDEAADSATLIDIIDVGGENTLDRLEKGRRALSDALNVSVDNETSVVSVAVETERYRATAAAVANRFVDLLGEFNTQTRQSNARVRRDFIEERMAQAELELVQAEEALEDFLESNRQFRGSPQLTFEYERLERQVTIKQEVFTTLRRSYEEARIQEVNDTPVITVIDRAVPPVRKSSPKRKLNVILAFIIGGVLSVVWAFGQEFVERAREREQAEVQELTSHWASMKSDLANLLRRRRS